MCGFVGFTAVDYDRETNQAVIKDMADRIAHRGPDDEGFFVDDDIAMGFRRLSIIDLEGSRQPMQNADGTVTRISEDIPRTIADVEEWIARVQGR